MNATTNSNITGTLKASFSGRGNGVNHTETAEAPATISAVWNSDLANTSRRYGFINGFITELIVSDQAYHVKTN